MPFFTLLLGMCKVTVVVAQKELMVESRWF